MSKRSPGRPSNGPTKQEHFLFPVALAAAIEGYAALHGRTKTDVVGEAVAARIGVPYRTQTALSMVVGETTSPDPAGLSQETRTAVDRACDELGLTRLEFVEAALQMALTRPDQLVQATRPAHQSLSTPPAQEVPVARSA